MSRRRRTAIVLLCLVVVPLCLLAIGVSWFSLVAAEMVSGQYGLGYVINTSYTMVRYPTIVIGMISNAPM